MANIPKGLLTGSDPAIVTGSYGPSLTVTAREGHVILAESASLTQIALHGPLGYTVDPAMLNPSTVPYVNAFIRDSAVIDKYWRSGEYRCRPVGGVTVGVASGVWVLTGTPVTGTIVPSAPSPLRLPVAATPAPVVKAKRAPKAKASKTVTGTTVFVPVPAPVLPVVITQPKRGKRRGIKPPEGYSVISGRSGELVVPTRTLATFAAAVRCRFDEGLPAHVLVIGPAGTGKTESVLALAALNGMEVAGIVSCGGIEGPSDLYGQTTPDETAPHGWRRMPSALWTALDAARSNPERRYFVLLDEVNRMGTLAAQNAVLSMLDGTEALANPATGESIPLPPNLFVAATANIGIAYSGTVRMDAALMSRWWTNLVFGYLPENVEQAIAKSITDNAEQSRYLARAASELRKAHGADEFRSALIPGTREIVAVAHQSVGDPEGVAGAWHDKITSSFSNEGRDPARTEFARVRIISEGVFKAPLVEEREDSDTPF
jgi:hypothetical protein